MPICQSPKIAEVLLQAKTAAANDNYAPVNKTMKALEPGSVFKCFGQRFWWRVTRLSDLSSKGENRGSGVCRLLWSDVKGSLSDGQRMCG